MNICDFLNNIKFYARAKNITIGQLEETAGVAAGYLSRIVKSGRNDIPFSVLYSISEQLDITIDKLIEHKQPQDIAAELIRAGIYDSLSIQRTDLGCAYYAQIGREKVRLDRDEFFKIAENQFTTVSA